MKQQYLLFDLDGTLTDPLEGIAKSAQKGLEHFGIVVEDYHDLAFFVGPPLKDTYMEHFGLTEEEATEAIKYFRSYFVPKGIYENEIYPGVKEMLAQLKAAGKTLLLATSKPTDFAQEVLRHFQIGEYFDFVGGSMMNEQRTKKSEVIAHVLDQFKISDVSHCVMIGDRSYDVEGAKEFHIPTVGVLYGYGSLQELEEAGAKWTVSSVEDLTELLLAE